MGSLDPVSPLEPCREFVTSTYLSKWNSTNTEILPLLSNIQDCSGPLLTAQQMGQITNKAVTWPNILNLGTIVAMYVPANWQVTFRSGGDTNVIRGPFLGSVDENNPTVGGVDIFGLFSGGVTAEFQRVAITPAEGIGTSWEENRLRICTGQNDFNLEGVIIPRYQPHQPVCDTIVTQYCGSVMNQDPQCNCIQENQELEKRYPTINLPVTCFGQKCGEEGYRTQEFASEKCSVTVCQSIIQQSGTDIFDSGTTTIYCGGTLFNENDVTPTPQPTATPSVQPVPQDDSIPYYIWILFSVVVVAAGVLIYIIVVKYQDPKAANIAARRSR